MLRDAEPLMVRVIGLAMTSTADTVIGRIARAKPNAGGPSSSSSSLAIAFDVAATRRCAPPPNRAYQVEHRRIPTSIS